MTITVPRPRLNWRERLYLPAIAAGLAITFKHFKNMLLGRTKVTMQYPEQKWDSHLPDYYRGAPTLVRDADGRVRCVACQLCEFICPPRAILLRKLAISLGDVQGNAVARSFQMVAGRGLFRYRLDEILRPGREFQCSFINGQLLVVKWHKGSESKRERKRRLEQKREFPPPEKCSPTRFRKRKASPAASAGPIEIAGASSAPT